jgi:hypothetical protein
MVGWNLKVTTKEVDHIVDKFKKTFRSLLGKCRL